MLKVHERNSQARYAALPVRKAGMLMAGLGAAFLLGGPSAAMAASQTCPVVFRVNNATDLRALQLTIDYSAVATGAFVGNTACTLPAGLTDVLNDQDGQSMSVGWADTVTFSGPQNFATCTFTTPGAAPVSGNFLVTVEDASGPNPPTPASPTPVITVSVGACVPAANACGNGIPEVGEECDDGNVVLGDGCGLACNDTGSCAATPASSCRHGESGKLLLKDGIKDPSSNAKDQGQYQLKKGDATVVGDFKNPVSGTATYSWCVYDAGQLILGKDIAPGAGWTAKGTTGFGFKGDASGVSQVSLKAGDAGSSQVQIKAKSKAGAFASPTLPLTEPALSQFVIDDGVTPICFETSFTGAAKNTESQYSAK